jgi:hypothetical protein
MLLQSFTEILIDDAADIDDTLCVVKQVYAPLLAEIHELRFGLLLLRNDGPVRRGPCAAPAPCADIARSAAAEALAKGTARGSRNRRERGVQRRASASGLRHLATDDLHTNCATARPGPLRQGVPNYG